MNVEKFINGICAVAHEATDADITVLIGRKDDLQEVAVCGFNPDTSPEHLELFVSMLTAIAQMAITRCGNDEEIIISGSNRTINVKENLTDIG